MRYVLRPAIAERLHPLDGFTVRTSEDARRTVVFFGASSPETGDIEFGGTGFLSSIRKMKAALAIW
jgi:hypothetical protein